MTRRRRDGDGDEHDDGDDGVGETGSQVSGGQRAGASGAYVPKVHRFPSGSRTAYSREP